jgi:putative membrane protein
MINKYSDHSANERTYLAWIRTAIAIMAFGFLIEKFEIFISIAHLSNTTSIHPSRVVEFVGISLFFVGLLMIISATIRFIMTNRSIELDKHVAYHFKKTTAFLSLLMILLAIFLFFYLSYMILI